jgi:bacterioferritin
MMDFDKDKVIEVLNQIVELELAGAVRFTQYSLMVFGHARIPIQGWMLEQAQQSLNHGVQAGEEVTSLGGRVSLGIGELVGTHHASVDEMLQEMIIQEQHGIALYRRLLELTEGCHVSLEEMARQMIRSEERDLAEIEKMLRKRGDA